MSRIFIIEDEQGIRETLTDLLELEGYAVDSAGSGEEGIEKISLQEPDLLICDIMLPGKGGFEVVDTLRRAHQFFFLPVIFLSAHSGHEYIRKGMRVGADDYLTKPFDNAELLEAVQVRLQKVAQIRETVETLRTNLAQQYAVLSDFRFINAHIIRAPLTNIMLTITLLAEDPQFQGHPLFQHLQYSANQLDRHLHEVNEVLSQEDN
ncbi:MAG: hypothetical protein OHK0039_29840 [Bacteroidia bacterium]